MNWDFICTSFFSGEKRSLSVISTTFTTKHGLHYCETYFKSFTFCMFSHLRWYMHFRQILWQLATRIIESNAGLILESMLEYCPSSEAHHLLAYQRLNINFLPSKNVFFFTEDTTSQKELGPCRSKYCASLPAAHAKDFASTDLSTCSYHSRKAVSLSLRSAALRSACHL